MDLVLLELAPRLHHTLLQQLGRLHERVRVVLFAVDDAGDALVLALHIVRSLKVRVLRARFHLVAELLAASTAQQLHVLELLLLILLVLLLLFV